MRKEIIWITAIGIFIGLVLAVGIYRINSRLKATNSNQTKPNSTAIPKTSNDFKITLNKPENEDVVTENSVSIEGITKSNSWIVLSSPEKDYLIKSDEKGFFKEDIDLIGGVNKIKITAYDSNFLKSEEKIVIIYSSSFVKTKIENLEKDNDSTTSSIRAKVQEKVNEVLSKPKGYIGTVTDKTNNSIEIKGESGEIRQISIENMDINIIKLGVTNKEIKLADIAIGDSIAALGYKDENAVLLAQRILVLTQEKPEELNIITGQISKVTKNSVFIDEIEYTFNKPSKIKFATLKVDQQIIIVGKRSLFVLE